MYKKQLMFFTSILVLISAFFFGCKEDKFDAGIDLVPDSLKISTSALDTFRIIAHTQDIDSFLTNSVSNVLLGKYEDDILGELKASFVTQLLISNSETENEKVTAEGVIPDSLVLYFRYSSNENNTYGVENKDCQVNIMRIGKFLDLSNEYYHNDTTGLNPVLDTSFTFNPKQLFDEAQRIADLDTLNNDDDTTNNVDPKPILSVKLSHDTFIEIFNLIDASFNGTSTFVEEMKGFYFTPIGLENSSVSIFDYVSADTKAVLYYHTEEETDTTFEYALGLNQSAVHFNLFEHNYNPVTFLPNLDDPDPQEDSVVYVQGAGGLNVKIQFPYIDQLAQQGLWAVNRAELVLPTEQIDITYETKFPAPEELILLAYDDEDGTFGLDEYFSDNGYTGAKYSNNQYSFDITLHVQKILKGEINNNGFLLMLKDGAINPSRVILTSGKHSNKMKLALTLTKLSD